MSRGNASGLPYIFEALVQPQKFSVEIEMNNKSGCECDWCREDAESMVHTKA